MTALDNRTIELHSWRAYAWTVFGILFYAAAGFALFLLVGNAVCGGCFSGK